MFSAMHDPKSRAAAYKGKGKGKGNGSGNCAGKGAAKGDGKGTVTGNGSGKCAGKGAAKGDGKGVGEVVGKGACVHIVGAQLSQHPRWCPVCAATVSALIGDQQYTTRCVRCGFLHPTS